MLAPVRNCPSRLVGLENGPLEDLPGGCPSCPRIPLLAADGTAGDVEDERLSLEMSCGWAYVADGSKRMPKGGATVTVCHQYGPHCSHGLFIGLLRMHRLHREKTHGRRPRRGRPSARDKRCASMEKDLRPDERLAQAIIPCRCPVEKTAAPKR